MNNESVEWNIQKIHLQLLWQRFDGGEHSVATVEKEVANQMSRKFKITFSIECLFFFFFLVEWKEFVNKLVD